MNALFSGGEVQRIAHVSARQLNWWEVSGLLAPSKATGEGNGRRTYYEFRDIVAIRTIAKLRAEGVSLQACHRVAKRLREMRGLDDNATALASSVLVVTSKDVMVVDGPALVSLVMRPGQNIAHALHLGGVVAELRAGAEKVKRVA